MWYISDLVMKTYHLVEYILWNKIKSECLYHKQQTKTIMKHNLNNTEELELKREIITCENVKCGIANKDNTILGDTLTMTSTMTGFAI